MADMKTKPGANWSRQVAYGPASDRPIQDHPDGETAQRSPNRSAESAVAPAVVALDAHDGPLGDPQGRRPNWLQEHVIAHEEIDTPDNPLTGRVAAQRR